MTKSLNEQNQKQLENQIQKDLSALNKLELWIKNVQDRIKTNRRKLVKMKTTQMNHNLHEKTKNDSSIIRQCLKFEFIETSTSCQKTNINPNNNSEETNPRTKSLKV
ncbi:unnamed protein product [Brachionus calyciflorus]|uniref:Uncharacterized protein n=1 Tax=Brachionus calyciflorus TaxID=104777 RepID=A0A814RMZ5_9BILA|nr:unnamed protein product [Brachionus calyciflorus]